MSDDHDNEADGRIELEPLYPDAAITRFETLRKRDAIHAASGKTFSTLPKIRTDNNHDGLNSKTCATNADVPLASPTMTVTAGFQSAPKEDPIS